MEDPHLLESSLGCATPRPSATSRDGAWSGCSARKSSGSPAPKATHTDLWLFAELGELIVDGELNQTASASASAACHGILWNRVQCPQSGSAL
jgi:hypothetical protein